MKKFIKFSFLFLIMFLFTKVVNANEAICKYEISEWPHTYKITVSYNNSVINASMEESTFVVLNDYSFKESDFFRSGQLACPKILYYYIGSEVIKTDPLYIGSQKTDRLSLSAPLTGETLKPSGQVPTPPGGPQNPGNDAVPETCTPTGRQMDICDSGETYDASRNMCRRDGVFRELTNKITNVNGGYNDYFLEWDMVDPSFGKCSKAYYYGIDSNGEPKCFQKVCRGVGYRVGAKCIICKELSSGGGVGGDIDETPIDPGVAPTCADFEEISGPIIMWMMIIAPILAIVFGTMDLLKAVAASDEKGSKKAISDFGKRLALCALLFLLTIVIRILVGFAGYGNSMACL